MFLQINVKNNELFFAGVIYIMQPTTSWCDLYDATYSKRLCYVLWEWIKRVVIMLGDVFVCADLTSIKYVCNHVRRRFVCGDFMPSLSNYEYSRNVIGNSSYDSKNAYWALETNLGCTGSRL